MGEPRNAGKTVIVGQVSPMPVTDIDWGTITITENWGRLFIKKGDAEIIVHQKFYVRLIAALSEFVAPEDMETTT